MRMKKTTAAILVTAMAMGMTVFPGCSKSDSSKVSSDDQWFNITKSSAQEYYDNIDFVYDDDRGDFLPLADHQKAVEHPQPRLRMRTGKHQQDLIHIADEHLTVFDFDAGGHADQFIGPRHDRFKTHCPVNR